MPDELCLIRAMAEKCSDVILKWHLPGLSHPASLQPKHLLWMCASILKHSNEWPLTKLHRWIGFVQGAMIANRMIDLKEAKGLFDDAKMAFGASTEDLLDHLNPDVQFEIDIGGES